MAIRTVLEEDGKRPPKDPRAYDPTTGKWVPVSDKSSEGVSNTVKKSTTPPVPSKDDIKGVDSKGKADKEYIKAEFNTLTGELVLTPSEKSIRIKVNDTIKIAGIGRYLSGLYFVSAVRRTLSKDEGYSHSFTLIKNGFDDPVKSSGTHTENASLPRKKEVEKFVIIPTVVISSPAKSYKDRFTDTNKSYLDYWVHLPKNIANNMPLVVFLHGIGEVGIINSLKNYGLISSARSIYGDSFPFIALYPNTHIQSWTHAEVPETLMHLIDYISNKYSVDKSRIILTGHSLGAYGVWGLINRYKNYFSCGVPVSGDPQETLTFSNFKDVPIRAMCGTGDVYENSYAVGMKSAVNSINSNGGKAQFVTMHGKTHPQTKEHAYSRETFEWMISQ